MATGGNRGAAADDRTAAAGTSAAQSRAARTVQRAGTAAAAVTTAASAERRRPSSRALCLPLACLVLHSPEMCALSTIAPALTLKSMRGPKGLPHVDQNLGEWAVPLPHASMAVTPLAQGPRCQKSADTGVDRAEAPPAAAQPTRKHVLVSSIPGNNAAVPKLPPAVAAARPARPSPVGGQRRGGGSSSRRAHQAAGRARRVGFDEFASDLEDDSSASDGEEFEMELALASDDGEDEFAATASGAAAARPQRSE